MKNIKDTKIDLQWTPMADTLQLKVSYKDEEKGMTTITTTLPKDKQALKEVRNSSHDEHVNRAIEWLSRLGQYDLDKSGSTSLIEHPGHCH